VKGDDPHPTPLREEKHNLEKNVFPVQDYLDELEAVVNWYALLRLSERNLHVPRSNDRKVLGI
jgi:hypothetical protein